MKFNAQFYHNGAKLRDLSLFQLCQYLKHWTDYGMGARRMVLDPLLSGDKSEVLLDACAIETA